MQQGLEDATRTVGVHGISEVREKHVHILQLFYSQIPELVLKWEEQERNENKTVNKTNACWMPGPGHYLAHD